MDDTQLGKKINRGRFVSGRYKYLLYRYFWSSIDLIYPPICGGCESKGNRWCDVCESKTEIINQPICPICGNSQESPKICMRCLRSEPRYCQLRSWAYFTGGLRNAIHRLKYRRDISLAEILSRPLIELIDHLNWTIDLVVPVPLSPDRQKSRGYNQAGLIALPIALGLNLKYQHRGLVKIKETNSQVGLSLNQRYENVSGAFKSDSTIVSNKVILIIDDVVTSGATLNECANALLKSGAKDIYAVTLARAMYNSV